MGKRTCSSWHLVIADENGKEQYFALHPGDGQYPREIPSWERAQGTSKVTMMGQADNGDMVKGKPRSIWCFDPAPKRRSIEVQRTFEFDDSQTIAMYEKYLVEVVTPKIPKGAKVLIHGYTDIIGDETYNEKLSMARANDKEHHAGCPCEKAGRTDVAFEVYGFGEDQSCLLFDNQYPKNAFTTAPW
ncbi:MAG: hypothetical protein IPJ00_12000 [Saprospirales bacterium]|nr:hypothetical protein [Saprospirales bacterium]